MVRRSKRLASKQARSYVEPDSEDSDLEILNEIDEDQEEDSHEIPSSNSNSKSSNTLIKRKRTRQEFEKDSVSCEPIKEFNHKRLKYDLKTPSFAQRLTSEYLVESITDRPAHRLLDLQIGGKVDVNPRDHAHRLMGWTRGDITDTYFGTKTMEHQVDQDSDEKEIERDEEEIFAQKQLIEQLTAKNNQLEELNKQTQRLLENTKTEKMELQNDMNEKEDIIEDLAVEIEMLHRDLETAKGELIVKEVINRYIQKSVSKKENVIEELEGTIEDMQEAQECVSCMEKKKDTIFDGCNHMALCHDCAAGNPQKVCPICRAPYFIIRQTIS